MVSDNPGEGGCYGCDQDTLNPGPSLYNGINELSPSNLHHTASLFAGESRVLDAINSIYLAKMHHEFMPAKRATWQPMAFQQPRN
jgi:hypothetical protein